MFSTSTAMTIIANMFTDTGAMLVVILTAIVTGALALVGLGYAWRHLVKRITGKKF